MEALGSAKLLPACHRKPALVLALGEGPATVTMRTRATEPWVLPRVSESRATGGGPPGATEPSPFRKSGKWQFSR